MNTTEVTRAIEAIRAEFNRQIDALEVRIRELEKGKLTARETLTLNKGQKAA